MRRGTTLLAAGVTAALSLSLVAAPATATDTTPAATAVFSSLTVSGLKSSYTLPTKGERVVTFSVNIAGTVDDDGYEDLNGDGLGIDYRPYGLDFYGPKVKKVSTRVKDPLTPRVWAPDDVANGANTYQLKLPYYAAPGRYEVSIPVVQRNWSTSPATDVQRVVKARFNVNANTKYSKSSTFVSAPSWKRGKTATFTIATPEYQRGGKVTLYWKKNGAKKYKKIKSATLKRSRTISKAVIKTKAVQGNGKIYFKVSGVKYAKGYKTGTYKITTRR